MEIGQRLQTARELRGMTQVEFGDKIGIRYKNAAERIRQYEKSIRTPKEEGLKKMAQVLDVNVKALTGPTGYEPEDVMQILFDLETVGYNVEISRREDHMVATISHPDLEQPLAELERVRTLWKLEELSEKEYVTWKLEWVVMS